MGGGGVLHYATLMQLYREARQWVLFRFIPNYIDQFSSIIISQMHKPEYGMAGNTLIGHNHILLI